MNIQKSSLARKNAELHYINILTYDEIIRATKSWINKLESL